MFNPDAVAPSVSPAAPTVPPGKPDSTVLAIEPDQRIYQPPSWFERLDLQKMFGRSAPLEVELGSGDGSFLIEWARRHPERDFIGVERLLGRIRKLDRKSQRTCQVKIPPRTGMQQAVKIIGALDTDRDHGLPIIIILVGLIGAAPIVVIAVRKHGDKWCQSEISHDVELKIGMHHGCGTPQVSIITDADAEVECVAMRLTAGGRRGDPRGRGGRGSSLCNCLRSNTCQQDEREVDEVFHIAIK